jgi:hypothetical protein
MCELTERLVRGPTDFEKDDPDSGLMQSIVLHQHAVLQRHQAARARRVPLGAPGSPPLRGVEQLLSPVQAAVQLATEPPSVALRAFTQRLHLMEHQIEICRCKAYTFRNCSSD